MFFQIVGPLEMAEGRGPTCYATDLRLCGAYGLKWDKDKIADTDVFLEIVQV